MKRVRMKWFKIMIAAVLLFSTLGAQVGFAENESRPVNFPDVPADHWAIKHVSKMALKGVITGYSDGTFGPLRDVSREEAITMAIRLMGLEAAATSSQTNIVLPFEVGNFFKPYVNYAFDQGLLNIQEELSALGPNRSGERWGSSPASREWIAKLTIRMINQQEAYSGTEMFSDQLDIAAWALGYVNTAVNLNIVTGRDGKFFPKDPVTRAEIATFFSRADIYLDEQPAFVAMGSVRDINSRSISIQQANGQAIDLEIDSNTAIFTYAQNESINYTAIHRYNEVYVIHRQGKAQYIEIVDDSTRSVTVQGKLTTAIQDGVLVMEVDGGQQMYELNFSALEIIDTEGRGLNTGSLVPNSTIELSYVVDENENRVVTTIKLIRASVTKKAEGKLKQLDRANAKIVVEETADQSETYDLASELATASAEVPYGDRTVKLDELQPGDLVSYQVEHDIVTKLELIEPLNPLLIRVEGIITVNDLRNRVLYFESEKTFLGHSYAAKVEVELEGVPLATEKDIVAGDEVVLYLNQHDQIVKVSIKNRSIAAKHMVSYFSYDEVSKSLLTRESGELKLYKVDADTVFRAWNKTVIPHDQVAKTLKEGQLLDIVYSTVTDHLISVTLSNEYNGTILANDVSNRKMTIATEDGERITFDIPQAIWFEIANQSIVTLNDFQVGDEVRVTLNGSQSAISSLQLKQKVLYKVKATNISTRKLTLINDKGAELEVIVPFQAIIKTAGNVNGEFKDILAGHDVFISYVGRTITQITIADVLYGKVTAVDHINHHVTFSNYNNRGTAKRLTVEPGTLIQENDRIYVIRDPEGGQSISVMNTLERTFWKYDSADRTVYFYKRSLNDRSDYTLHINALISQGGKTIETSNLRDGDKVKVYLYNDMIMEIEK